MALLYVYKSARKFSPNLLLTHSEPPESSPLSYDCYPPGRVKANMCLLWDTWSHSQPHPFKRQLSTTHLEESTFDILLHTWPHRRPWLASVAVISLMAVALVGLRTEFIYYMVHDRVCWALKKSLQRQIIIRTVIMLYEYRLQRRWRSPFL